MNSQNTTKDEKQPQEAVSTAAALLQKLVRFDTTNPPGNETPCAEYLERVLREAGLETALYGKSPERKNLFARLPGRGRKPPFLMYGHMDVVKASLENWKHPPFEGAIAEGCIWGRGTLDMKGALAMYAAALVRLAEEGFVPEGDILFAALADEEVSGEFGADYMTTEHAELFRNVRYAIGEIGGFTMHLGGKRFYPVMIAEKQRCPLRLSINGPGGHGSLPVRDGAMAKLAEVLRTLNSRRLPVHVTPPVRKMIRALAKHLGFPAGALLRLLLVPGLTDPVLNLLGKSGKFFDPVLHNTVNATIVRGGEKINVIPERIELELDGRILPGFGKEDLVRELSELLGSDVKISIQEFQQGPETEDMGLFETLSTVLKEGEAEGIPVPFVVSGVTDARFFSRLGIQTYGFTPMILPEGMDFSKLIHAADERIPLAALDFGTAAVERLLRRL